MKTDLISYTAGLVLKQKRQIIKPQNDRVVSFDVDFGQKADVLALSSGISRFFSSKEALMERVKANPAIRKILDNAGLPFHINKRIIVNLREDHAKLAKNVAAGIIDYLPDSIKPRVNKIKILTALDGHDSGKAFLSITNKPAGLTPQERAKMELHSTLGYEVLKTAGIDPEVLQLIKYHHQNLKGTGYPAAGKDFVASYNLRVVNVADQYSALRAKRCYKPQVSAEDALKILRTEAEEGKIDKDVFWALEKYVKTQESKKLFPSKPQR